MYGFRYLGESPSTRRYHVAFRVAQYLRSLCWGPGSFTFLHADPGSGTACLPDPRAHGLASATRLQRGLAVAISRSQSTDCADGTLPGGAYMTPGYHDLVAAIDASGRTGGSETLIVFPTQAWAVSVPSSISASPSQSARMLKDVAQQLTSFIGTDRGYEYSERWCAALQRCGFGLRLLPADAPWDLRIA